MGDLCVEYFGAHFEQIKISSRVIRTGDIGYGS